MFSDPKSIPIIGCPTATAAAGSNVRRRERTIADVAISAREIDCRLESTVDS
jgi:hypothetical protein